ETHGPGRVEVPLVGLPRQHLDDPVDHRAARLDPRAVEVAEPRDADRVRVVATGLRPDDELVERAAAPLVDRAEAVHEELVADVGPAVRLHVVAVDALDDRGGLVAAVGVGPRRVVHVHRLELARAQGVACSSGPPSARVTIAGRSSSPAAAGRAVRAFMGPPARTRFTWRSSGTLPDVVSTTAWIASPAAAITGSLATRCSASPVSTTPSSNHSVHRPSSRTRTATPVTTSSSSGSHETPATLKSSVSSGSLAAATVPSGASSSWSSWLSA